jgi:hypothetical protein
LAFWAYVLVKLSPTFTLLTLTRVSTSKPSGCHRRERHCPAPGPSGRSSIAKACATHELELLVTKGSRGSLDHTLD